MPPLEEAREAFRATKTLAEGSPEWVEAANVVDAYLDEMEAQTKLRREVRSILRQLYGENAHWLYTEMDGLWGMFIVDSVSGEVLSPAIVANRELEEIRDDLRDMLTNQTKG